jgi:dihydrofolate synthase/folylpolyglutamate synthase
LDVRVLTDSQGSARYESLQLPLIGRHQAANAAVALATIEELRRQGWPITDAAVREGLNRVRWPARIEVIARRPTIVLDAAHNVASVEALVEVLGESFAARRRVLVFATTRDKNLRGMLQRLVTKFDDVIFTRYHSNPRGVAPQELVDIARELDSSRDYVMCDDARAAWEIARSWVDAQDLLCIAGSFFIAAEMRAAIEETSRPQH